MPIERIASLRDLVQPVANAVAILQQLYTRAGDGRSSRGTHVADVLRIIARHVVRAPAEDVAVIADLGKRVRLQYHGLTPKNENAIARALRPGRDMALRELPEALLKAARKALEPPANPRRAVSLALRALAIAFLLSRPLRRANLIGLHLDRHLQRDDPGRPDIHRGQIQAAETKNNNAIALPVPPRLNQVLQEWLLVFRPLIAPPGNRYLFPGGGTPDSHITSQGFCDAVRSATRQGIGVELTPHQFRHLAGKRYLAAHPDALEAVKQLLGHKRLETTAKHYIGSQVEVSALRFDELVTRDPVPPAKPKKTPKRPRGRPRKRRTPTTPTPRPPGDKEG
jgi:integrase